jgi:hypothetical protein
MASYEFSDAIPGNSSTERTVHFILYTQFITDEANKTVGATWVKRTFPDSLVHVPIHCSAMKLLLAFIEIHLSKQGRLLLYCSTFP